MILKLDYDARTLVGSAFDVLVGEVEHVSRELSVFLQGVQQPSELTGFLEAARRLQHQIASVEKDAMLEWRTSEDERRLLRAALSHLRRGRAARVERSQQQITSPAMSHSLGESFKALDALLESPVLIETIPAPVPALADFLTVEGRGGRDAIGRLADEERDQKHRILLSSALIPADIEVYRRGCEERRLPLAVVFADLDDFRQFNSTLGEVTVDRMILPRILNAVEAASYGHGRAYRHGGDEFVLLLPNADAGVAMSLVTQLKQAVEGIAFEDTHLVPRLSAGVWITTPGSHLTANEVVSRASEAKAKSKAAGKSRTTIRLEIGSRFDEQVTK